MGDGPKIGMPVVATIYDRAAPSPTEGFADRDRILPLPWSVRAPHECTNEQDEHRPALP